MGIRAKNGALLVGLLAIVVMVLVLFLVPTITSEVLPPISTLGQVTDPQSCKMYDPNADVGEGESGVTLVADEVHIYDSMFEQHPEWYPEVNAVMRCEAQIDNYVGSAFQISGVDYNSSISCQIAYPGLDPAYKLTTNWTQTISPSGNVMLSCRFKK